jgi:hypothetical protein
MENKGILASLLGDKPLGAAIEMALLTFVGYQIALVIYRLIFHPLAKFPGPRLAGATYWYEYYYDVHKDGQYIWRIQEMHDHYGETQPI